MGITSLGPSGPSLLSLMSCEGGSCLQVEEKHFPARGVCLSWIIWSWQKCAKDGNLAETKREAEDWGQEVRGSKEGWMAERGPAATDFAPQRRKGGEASRRPVGGTGDHSPFELYSSLLRRPEEGGKVG